MKTLPKRRLANCVRKCATMLTAYYYYQHRTHVCMNTGSPDGLKVRILPVADCMRFATARARLLLSRPANWNSSDMASKTIQPKPRMRTHLSTICNYARKARRIETNENTDKGHKEAHSPRINIVRSHCQMATQLRRAHKVAIPRFGQGLPLDVLNPSMAPNLCFPVG